MIKRERKTSDAQYSCLPHTDQGQVPFLNPDGPHFQVAALSYTGCDVSYSVEYPSVSSGQLSWLCTLPRPFFLLSGTGWDTTKDKPALAKLKTCFLF